METGNKERNGDLPNGWVSSKISELVEIGPGAAIPDTLSPAGAVHFIPMSAVCEEFGGIDVSAVRPYEEVKKGYTIFTEGDVLFAKITPCMENGKLAIVPPLREMIGFGSTEFHVLRPNAAVRNSWIAYYLSQISFRKRARNDMTGSAGQLRVSTAWLSSFCIPLAPLSEQTRIVAKLEELFSDLDAAVAELKAAQRKLVQYRQSLLRAAVEGTLTAEWRRTNQPAETGAQLLARIRIERRRRWEEKRLAKFASQGKTPPKDWQDKYPEPVNPDTAGLPDLPEGWVWGSAEQICDFITKGTTPPKNLADGEEKVIPFLRVTNLTNSGSLDFSDRVFVSQKIHKGFLERSIVYPNDVLMNIVGPPLGQVSIVPNNYAEWNINQAIAIFRPISGVDYQFLATYLLSDVAQKWLKERAKTTAGQANLTLEICRALPVPIVPMQEQMQVVSTNDELLRALSSQESAVAHSLALAAAQRQNILRAAFSGKLVPQDPADEPASALLERIRVERAACGAGAKGRRGRKGAV